MVIYVRAQVETLEHVQIHERILNLIVNVRLDLSLTQVRCEDGVGSHFKYE